MEGRVQFEDTRLVSVLVDEVIEYFPVWFIVASHGDVLDFLGYTAFVFIVEIIGDKKVRRNTLVGRDAVS